MSEVVGNQSPDVTPLEDVMSAPAGDKKLPIAREQLTVDRLDTIADALESGQHVMVTREGRMIGLVVPISLGELMTRALEANPEWAAQVRDVNPTEERETGAEFAQRFFR